MVVLINGDTASASEIVAAALEQAGYATVVGTRSFGKGTFQEVIPLDNGGALDLTVGEYLTRDGTSINGTGIKPQVRAKDVPSTKPDEALDRALQVLGRRLARPLTTSDRK
jgi:carboxyl-terminal processing protease